MRACNAHMLRVADVRIIGRGGCRFEAAVSIVTAATRSPES